jgi:hypothetical protein
MRTSFTRRSPGRAADRGAEPTDAAASGTRASSTPALDIRHDFPVPRLKPPLPMILT